MYGEKTEKTSNFEFNVGWIRKVEREKLNGKYKIERISKLDVNMKDRCFVARKVASQEKKEVSLRFKTIRSLYQIGSDFFDSITTKKFFELKHPHLTTLFDYIIDFKDGKVGNLFIVTEQCEYSILNVLEVMEKRFSDKRLMESEIAAITKSILLALSYLHDNNFTHNGIQTSKFLLMEDGCVKLDLFDHMDRISRLDMRRDYSTFLEPPNWLPPETIEMSYLSNNIASNRSDIWQLGISILEMAEGEPPYWDRTPLNTICEIIKSQAPQFKKREMDPWSDEMKDFLKRCVVKNMIERASADELLSHPWLEKFGLAGVESTNNHILVLKKMVRRLDLYNSHIYGYETEISKKDEEERLHFLLDSFRSTYCLDESKIVGFGITFQGFRKSFFISFALLILGLKKKQKYYKFSITKKRISKKVT